MNMKRATETRRGTPLPLDGVKVVGLEQFIAGPCTTMFLADAGADVIKIEPPEGEAGRHMGPLVDAGDIRYSGFFARFNRGKRSVVADLRTAEGQVRIRDLVLQADVVVENFRPGTLAKYGLDYPTLKADKPDLVYCSVSGFGVDPDTEGPYSDWPAFDIAIQAMGGLMHICGDDPDGPPVYPGFGIADFGTSMFAAFAIVQALYRRLRTGQGAWLDVPMYDATVWFNERAMTTYAYTGQTLARGVPSLAAPWGAFPTADGYIALIVPTDRHWLELCGVMSRSDLAEDPDLATADGRVAQRDSVVHPAVRDWTSRHASDDIVARLVEVGLPCGHVQDAATIANCPQLASRGLFWSAQGDVPDETFMVGAPWRFVGEEPQPVPRVPSLDDFHGDEDTW